MLKKVIMSGKEVPVPIPLLDVSSAIQWIEKMMLDNNHVVTKATLDDVEIDLDKRQCSVWQNKLTASSKLEVSLDSPKTLSSQLCEAIHELSFSVSMRAKKAAATYWKEKELKVNTDLKEVKKDCECIYELVENLNTIVPYEQVDMAPINGMNIMLGSYLSEVENQVQLKDWKKVADLLVNCLAAMSLDLMQECDVLQSKVAFCVDEEGEAIK